jgi:hypothetical protein
MTTKISADGVLACLNSSISLHSKLAVENRPAAGPFTNNGKHNKPLELQERAAENLMLHGLY